MCSNLTMLTLKSATLPSSPGMAIDPARSAQMARVRAKDTKPEMRVRRMLHAAGACDTFFTTVNCLASPISCSHLAG